MKFTRSIRWRLQLWLGLLLVAILMGFGVTAYQLQRTQVMSRIDEDLASRAGALSETARRGPGGPRPDRNFGDRPPPEPPRGGPGPELQVTEALATRLGAGSGCDYVVWRPGGEVRGTSFSEVPPIPERRERDTTMHFRSRGEFREAYHFTEMGECVLVGRPISGEVAGLHREAAKLALAGLGVLALGLGGGWWLTSRSLRPVEEMSRTARRIAEGNLSERVPVGPPGNELGQLATVLNRTFDRLEAAFGRQKQFTADASHELRTPLTLMISEAQAVLARDRGAGEYREAVEQCLEAARRMRDLTASLLQLARIEDGDVGAGVFDLREPVEAAREEFVDRARERGVAIEVALKSVVCRGDRVRAGMVISNLLSNALDHTPQGGWIRVASAVEGADCVLTVADSGPGIASEDLPHVFERFYRADKVRSRADGRFGLGLAICKAAVEADGGSISVTSEPGRGACFAVKWSCGG